MSQHHDLIRAMPIWSGIRTIERLKGGLSNESYTVTDRSGKFVVRFMRDFPFHHVSRAREIMSTRAAHAAGFAPELVHAEPGIMVSRFIEGRTYTAADMFGNLDAVIALVRRFHRDVARHLSGPGFAFWVFHVIRDYARQLAEGNSRVADRLPGFLDIAEALEAVQVALPVTVGHHDLLPANLIDDGSRLWLIDYEYAGFGTAMFDLANLTSNAGFDAGASEAALGLYFGGVPETALVQAHAAMECASLLREAMWSMVSELYLDTPGVDYVAYSDEIMVATEAALDAYQGRFSKL